VDGCEGATVGSMVGFSDGCSEGAVVGQDEASHVAFSVVDAHVMPSPVTGAVMVRVLRCAPVPHVTEHKPQACQAPIVQSTGQLEVEHVCVSDSMGHCEPPSLAAVSTNRDRVVLAVPQLTEQDAHEPHAPMMQSTGQINAPHSALSVVASRQAAPKPA
jgi:hypothetical protein